MVDSGYPTVIAGPLDQVRVALEAATAPDLDPEQAIEQLDRYAQQLTDLLGLAQTYRADVELVREAQQQAERDGEIREQLLRRGLATAEELAELGYGADGDSTNSKVDTPHITEAGADAPQRIREEPSAGPDALNEPPEPDPGGPLAA